jgi:cation-transporting P-type ATPase C
VTVVAADIRSDAAGRLRLITPDLRGAPARRAVAVEDALMAVPGVRAAHVYPRTGSVVVWYRSTTDRAALHSALADGLSVDLTSVARAHPHSADITNTELVRLGIGAGALVLLGLRRYGFRRPRLLGPASRTVATGVTIFSGYPFLKGALRSLRGGRAGTDALVSAATVASLLLRENVVALTVLWLLNIGEFLQDLTLRRPAGPSRICCAATPTPPGSSSTTVPRCRCPSTRWPSATSSSSTTTSPCRPTGRSSTASRWSISPP